MKTHAAPVASYVKPDARNAPAAGAGTGAALVQLSRVAKEYGSGRKFIAVEGVDLTIREGEFVALLGPSGCGKSTILRMISGLIRPTRGDVLYRGKVLSGVNPHAAIVFQTFALFPWLTVQENVEVALKARGVPPGLRTNRALDLLDRVGLDGFETAYPRELSGGMRQKVGFARAMAVEPELLCLDEPFSALDVLSAETLRGELLELWTSGKIPTRAILMVSHNIDEAVFMADRIVIMDKDPGRIIREFPVDLPRPRQRKSHDFLNLVDRVYAMLAGQTLSPDLEMGTAPGEPGVTRRLPAINVNEMAGLIERLNELVDHKTDIYRIAHELKVGSDYILSVIDAAELLGFATISAGDIKLTPLGETFGEASILARKEIFASRLRHLPFFRWLTDMVRAGGGKGLSRDVIETALAIEFPAAEAERQVDTAINWGRYAELLSYDDDDETLYVEPAGGQAA
ncbi:ABC nitrate/sulfonate/bicarbonate family transporter, ATPase subunit [Desulfovibrio sp. X2]|uniref:ABC transporter ATP-binding protein n=1 Tax=Desulfovibrio sp. X2 TaxID=941449 RepID=UPI000358A6C6|nr:nitrate/sulfonate/bicarbonate ABC transporter ATP-binding protein [Desulfovibrio sp. X2]EPR42127.1 ABC nitrate/sulfonate/bicarbonate family transporter, ATPase subunit [Desulfovibrio sp. X2]